VDVRTAVAVRVTDGVLDLVAVEYLQVSRTAPPVGASVLMPMKWHCEKEKVSRTRPEITCFV
jgi:hypothetical protein